MTQQLLSSPAPQPRPYRVCNWDRSLRKGIMAQSLAELLRQVSWGGSVCLPGDCVSAPSSPPAPLQAQSALLTPGPISLVLDEDGTVVETEAFFRTLEEGTVLMALSKGQAWAASKVSALLGGRSLNSPLLHPTLASVGGDAMLAGRWARWD